MTETHNTIAIIVAAGRGTRLGAELPKAYLPVGGEPLLRKTVRAFASHPLIDAVQVVIHPDDETLYQKAVEGLDVLPSVHGGKSRSQSVYFGTEIIQQYKPLHVLIHDAARCFVGADTITRVVEALGEHKAVIPALSIADTIKKIKDSYVSETFNRDDLVAAQTPQGFSYELIANLHAKSTSDTTDDAALCEAAGVPVQLVPGDARNIKITVREDIPMTTRIGQGYDVHAFANGDHIICCGVKVSHTHGLSGHSDADVGLHALTDALLGAIGAGDIGEHFPPSDPQWKGADSSQFIEHAAALATENGARVVNADITIICEAPKLSPYKDAMRARVAELLAVPAAAVNIKATTTEGLGFTGRGEGMAASAVVSIEMNG